MRPWKRFEPFEQPRHAGTFRLSRLARSWLWASWRACAWRCCKDHWHTVSVPSCGHSNAYGRSSSDCMASPSGRSMSGDCWARGAGDRVDVHPYEVREDLPEESGNTVRHQGFPNLDGRRRSIQYLSTIIAADSTARLSVMRREAFELSKPDMADRVRSGDSGHGRCRRTKLEL